MAAAMKKWKAAQATEEVVQRIYEACEWEDDGNDEMMFALPSGKEAGA
jgi:hypothetical protein